MYTNYKLGTSMPCKQTLPSVFRRVLQRIEFDFLVHFLLSNMYFHDFFCAHSSDWLRRTRNWVRIIIVGRKIRSWNSILLQSHSERQSLANTYPNTHTDNLLRAAFVLMRLTLLLDGRWLFSFSAWNLRSTLDNNWSKRPVGTQAHNYHIPSPKGHTQYA